jgi:hypothetical protein
MAHLVLWDFKYKRPVVDGKVVNPETGLVEEAGSERRWLGPPAVDVIWHNLNALSDFRTTRAPFVTTVDKVFVEIANHIRDGVYSIVSVSASAYSFTIICDTKKTSAEFREALKQMREHLYGISRPPPSVEARNDG